MKSKRLANSLKLLLVILILSVAVFVGYYIKNKQNPFVDIVNNLKKDSTFYDNLNGIYIYREEIGATRNPFSGCSFNSMNNYLLIINDNYKAFRSSCMGTYLKDSGNIDDLDIQKEGEEPYINYKDHRYVKDKVVTSIVPNNIIETRLRTIDLTNLQFIMKETEFDGNYYIIDSILKNNPNIRFYYEKDEGSTLDTIHILGKESEYDIYSYSFEDYDELPEFYAFGIRTIVIEKTDNRNNHMKYGYNFYVINEKEIEYNLSQMFPIVVNDQELTIDDNSIYVMYDRKDRAFKMFVGFNKKMCVEDSDEHVPVYYEFKLVYNYSRGGFDKPEFVKVGYEDEGCNYISNYVVGG